MIKALETKWGGYTFRSRTEARWAVFMDAAGIQFEYEREGFKLPSGYYLPDFWLPKRLAYLEIKGVDPTPYEVRLGEELANATGHWMIFAVGEPTRDQVLRQFPNDMEADHRALDADCDWPPAHAYAKSRGERFGVEFRSSRRRR